MENETQFDQKKNDLSGLTTGKLLIMSVVSANIYLFISLLIIKYLHEGWVVDLFDSNYMVFEQVGFGVGAGLLSSAIIFLIIKIPPVSNVLSDFSVFKALSTVHFSLFDKIQISVFAGAGEEILFRGAIQPLIGNVFTSIIFIGIHGYFKFKSPGHILFGLMMFGLSLMLGFLALYVGLIAAMIAHSVYDLVMLILIQKK
ncbi:CPBP family intramembrane glutamic endopeptidase [Gracilimonas sp. Q87]|uniref:CPBP family intramembrane glutamic endopeptidase n=1 Tax=Gracilimonas sp. Q87 TaxID=3384766 RepID=UPI0039843DB1